MAIFTLLSTAHISNVLDYCNHVIAIGVVVFIYLIELYCIYLDRNKQRPEAIDSMRRYQEYYGRGQGWAIFNLNMLIGRLYGEKLFGIKWALDRPKVEKYIYGYLLVLVMTIIILLLMFIKNFIFKLAFNSLFPMTILTCLCGYIYFTYIKAQNDIFTKEKVPSLLKNIFSSTVYKDISFNDIVTSFIFNDKNVGQMEYNYTLKDFYINSCHRPYIIGDDKSSPTIDVLQDIINAGARYLTFDIFEDLITADSDTLDIINKMADTQEEEQEKVTGEDSINAFYIPNVRTLYVKKENGISFVDMMTALSKTKPFSQNKQYPLILQINCWSQNEDKLVHSGFKYQSTYDIIHSTLKDLFPAQYGLSGSNQFGYGGAKTDKSSLGNIPIKSCTGRLLLVSNNVYQYTDILKSDKNYNIKHADYIKQQDTLMRNIKPYIYGTVNIQLPSKYINKIEKQFHTQIDPNMRLNHYTKDQYSEGLTGGKDATTITNFVDENKTGMRIVIPADCTDQTKNILRYNTFNPRVLDCMNYGAQVILINYQYMGQELENYLQIFNKTSFVLKPQLLRELPPKSSIVSKQTTKVSFAPRSAGLLGVIDDPIVF